MNNEKHFAILIDSDNISSKYIHIILDEISKIGTITIKRIYGDWTSPNVGQWKKPLLDYSIIPVQQYSYTTGKSSTDSAMIIDAMDILYSKKVEGFVLVSSDSDFTRLAVRLREAGEEVIGMGEKKTPKPFISSCNQFKYLDNLFEAVINEEKETKRISTNKDKEIEISTDFKPVVGTIRSIINESSDEDGWLNIANLGSILVKRYPDFDVRNYGYSKMKLLLGSIDTVEVKTFKQAETNVTTVFVRNLKKSKRNTQKN